MKKLSIAFLMLIMQKGMAQKESFPDGTFKDEGALNILNHQTTDPDEFNITVRPEQGSYEIKNYTLLFRYSDGRKLQIVFKDESFDRKDPGPSSITLSFNEDILYKRK